MINMDVTQNVLDYTWEFHGGIMSLRATFLQERKECEEKYCKKVENEES